MVSYHKKAQELLLKQLWDLYLQDSDENFLKSHPALTKEDLQTCKEFTNAVIHTKII